MSVKRAMKILGIALGVVAGVIVVLTLVGTQLPSRVGVVDISTTIDAPRGELFPFFNSREGQQRLWDQLLRRPSNTAAPPMVIVHLGGPEEGVGSRLGFFPDTTRMGSIGGVVASLARGIGIVVESDAPRRVVSEIDFGIVVAHRTIDLEAIDERATRVSWSETLEFGNPLMRTMTLFVGPSSMNANFEALLEALRQLVES